MLPASDAIPSSPPGAEKLLDSSKAVSSWKFTNSFIAWHHLVWGSSHLGHHLRCSALP